MANRHMKRWSTSLIVRQKCKSKLQSAITLHQSKWTSFKSPGTSLVAQWLGICLAMQRMQVPSLIRKLRPRRPRGTRAHATPEPVRPANYGACAVWTPRASTSVPVSRQHRACRRCSPRTAKKDPTGCNEDSQKSFVFLKSTDNKCRKVCGEKGTFHKKNEIISLATMWMDLETRERQIADDITYLWNNENTNDVIYRTEIDSQTQKTKLMVTKGDEGMN